MSAPLKPSPEVDAACAEVLAALNHAVAAASRTGDPRHEDLVWFRMTWVVQARDQQRDFALSARGEAIASLDELTCAPRHELELAGAAKHHVEPSSEVH